MTAIEDARAALAEIEAARTVRERAKGRARVEAALRALIAEHERLATASKGVELIAAERARQPIEEGYTAEHDRGHAGQLALAGMGYAAAGADDLGALSFVSNDPDDPAMDWPWHPSYWKPTGDAVRDLTKAGALIAAAIDSKLADDKSRTHCRECREGKHGACDGSMYVEELDVVEACGCAAYDWDGEHTSGGGR